MDEQYKSNYSFDLTVTEASETMDALGVEIVSRRCSLKTRDTRLNLFLSQVCPAVELIV